MSYLAKKGRFMDSVEGYVRRYALDRLLSPELLDALGSWGRGPGELIIRAGDPVRDIHFFVEGLAKVYSTMENGQRLLAAFYRPFDVFGEAELFSPQGYTLSVEAMSESFCLSLPVAAIRKTAERNGRLFMYLCYRMGAKLAERVVAESINLRYPVESRLASYLFAATDAAGWILGRDDLGEIADFLGSSYRQLARVVRGLRDEGILERTRGRIRVLDRPRLERLAGDLYLRPGMQLSPQRFLEMNIP